MADFLRLIDVNAGGLRLKKGQGILHLTCSAEIDAHGQTVGFLERLHHRVGYYISVFLSIFLGKYRKRQKISLLKGGCGGQSLLAAT